MSRTSVGSAPAIWRARAAASAPLTAAGRLRARIKSLFIGRPLASEEEFGERLSPITIVVLPEYVARHRWDRVLYNLSAKRLKAALVRREHTVIADVPHRRGH